MCACVRVRAKLNYTTSRVHRSRKSHLIASHPHPLIHPIDPRPARPSCPRTDRRHSDHRPRTTSAATRRRVSAANKQPAPTLTRCSHTRASPRPTCSTQTMPLVHPAATTSATVTADLIFWLVLAQDPLPMLDLASSVRAACLVAAVHREEAVEPSESLGHTVICAPGVQRPAKMMRPVHQAPESPRA